MFGQEARYKMINGLLKEPKKIRNVSIVAHVDHGKTTLADCLIASNGIIHRKQAGQLKLLDDRLDQQDRGITMKASSIALVYKEHLINLIDSPGHLQFYSEVSAALRLTDSALLVVDTVEGVSSQTFRVLHQLYREKLPAILVLNKIDKLITHCKMDPMQAFQHLSQTIQQVNAILGSFIAKEVGTIKTNKPEEGEPIDTLESHFYFSPEKKNIVFASSLDNWGFSVESFSGLIAKKLGKEPHVIEKYLWGEYYFNPKTKSFQTEPRNENDRPICVEWLLKPIWDIFEHVENENFQKIDKIIGTLNLKVSESAKKAKGYALIKQILNSWLPLDKLLLERIVKELPNPIEAQKFRLPYLLQLNLREEKLNPAISNALETCSNSQEAPLIGFISKMVTVPKKQINQRGLGAIEDDSLILGFARIFSGTIKRNQEILVIGVKPKKIEGQQGEIIEVPDIVKAKITGLYFFNGQYPEGIMQASAGCVVGIAGLEADIFKSGTISTSEDCISFVPVSSQTKSILKVSVSTPDIKDSPKLLEGLKKLNRSDPSVDVYVEGTGDIILNTCGQVHLEKCVVDLQSIYSKCPIQTSDPIITFRETITWSTLKEIKNEKYLQELEKKRKIQEKKLLKEHYKAQMKADAELDEQEKEKLRALKEWDSHVQIYESEDLTVEDTRYFLKNRNDVDEYKKDFGYREEKELKKLDHKNRGKYHRKNQCLNLNLKTNLVNVCTPNNKLKISVRALGMPFAFAEYLQKQNQRMNKLFSVRQIPQGLEESPQELKIKDQTLSHRKEFLKEMLAKMQEEGMEEELKELVLNKMVCFGPTASSGTNILICRGVLPGQSFFERALNYSLYSEISDWDIEPEVLEVLEEYKTTIKEFVTSVTNGFWLACQAGPLANEQIMGVVFIIEKIKVIRETKEEKEEVEKIQKMEKNEKKEVQEVPIKQKEEENKEKKEDLWALDNFGPLAGQLISTVKDGCIQSFLGGGPRVVEPMYLCELHTDQQYYGSIHNQLSKRRAQIIDEDLHQFSNFLIIKAYLPMLESHNFCFDILDKTQGTVNAQLHLDTWKVIEEDPFYTPLTMEQIEENGLDKNQYNQARIILEKIRQKKGLSGTEKIVVAAEKQRTLKKD